MKKNQIQIIQYPLCTTCKKAVKWLADHNVDVVLRNIKENKPQKEELRTWIERSGLPINKFFNTSGKIYKENKLKEKVATATNEELLDILSSDGMVVKRPIVVADSFVLVGFKEDEWTKHLL